MLEGKQFKPGESGFARLKLDDPRCCFPGDRFIIRQFSPVITIGGGVVLDALEPVRRTRQTLKRFTTDGVASGPASLAQPSKAAERLAFLQTIANSDASTILLARVERRASRGFSVPDAVAETGWPRTRVESVADGLIASRRLLQFGDILLSTTTAAQLTAVIKTTVDAFHQANPLVAGISREELREKLDLSPDVYRGIEDLLVRDMQLVLAGELIHAAGRGVALRDDEAESKKQIEAAFASAGLKVPALKEVLASLPVDKVRAQKIVTLLLRDRVLVKLADDLVFHRDALDALRKLVLAQKAKTPKLNVVAFKDLTGVSRKYAIPLLEYLDRERVTRRVGDERVIL